MTHELIRIFEAYSKAQSKQLKTVLATVVDLEGSSYRRPGVRMLLIENGEMIGAVSGGCVEKEVFKQSESVFSSSIPKVMTYDGRYRLGCEGLLYILLEPFKPSDELIQTFNGHIGLRNSFKLHSYFVREEQTNATMKTLIEFNDSKTFPLSGVDIIEATSNKLIDFSQEMKPRFQLLILGGEHDAVALCKLGAGIGWEVTVVVSPKSSKSMKRFPGARRVLALTPEELKSLEMDTQTAVVLMTHNYASDLNLLLQLIDINLLYIGILGPAKRKEKLLGDLMDFEMNLCEEFIDSIHGPAGINVGAETPEEISISILAEILAVHRNQKPLSLRNKKTGIHS